MSLGCKLVASSAAALAAAALISSSASAAEPKQPTSTTPAHQPFNISCGGGYYNWNTLNGPVTMSVRPNDVNFFGPLLACSGAPGLFAAVMEPAVVHGLTVSCSTPSQGQFTSAFHWSNYQISKFSGILRIDPTHPTISVLPIVSGWGKGHALRLTLASRITPQAIGCLGPGISTGTFDIRDVAVI